ncbi:hypothetical protein LguiB_031192 [Lonicera macranthoides]
MSILGGSSNRNNSGNMGAPFFSEFKKHASFFFKEKIKTARLALTDVTPAQLLTEEATNGNPWTPDARTLKIIARDAFEVDDYWRIVDILHNRLVRFDRKNWRQSYNAVIVLDYLLTHGPESVAEEFQSDKDVLKEMGSFQHIDEKGFNWGLHVAKKSAKILVLLEERPLLKEERHRARNLSRGIQGFGSFTNRTLPAQGILQESSTAKYGRYNSQFNLQENDENQFPPYNNEYLTKQDTFGENANPFSIIKKMVNSISRDSHTHCQTDENLVALTSCKENMVPQVEEKFTGESKPLLENDSGDGIFVEEDHPLNDARHLSTASLLSSAGKILQAC